MRIGLKHANGSAIFEGDAPGSWEELGSIAIPVLRDLVNYAPGEGKLRAIQRILGIKIRYLLCLDTVQLADLDHAFSWLTLAPCQKPLFQKLTYKLTDYYLPDPKFAKGTAAEYATADEYFEMANGEDDEALLMLTATLLRPKGKPHTNRTDIQNRAKKLRGLKPEYFAAVWMYWAGVKQYVHDTYGAWLFSGTSKEDGGGKGAMFGWWGVYMDVAESGVFGNITKVYETNFHEICMYLVKKKNESMELQRRMKQQKNRS